MYSGEFERHDLQVTQRTIELRRLAPALDGLRIAQISDIHFEQYTEASFVRRVVDEVNQLAPDIVVLTGDYVSEAPLPKSYGAKETIRVRRSSPESNARKDGACSAIIDTGVDPVMVTYALEIHGLPVLAYKHIPLNGTAHVCGLAASRTSA